MASMQASFIGEMGNPYYSNFRIDSFDRNGIPLSRQVHCIGVEYKGRIFSYPHEIERDEHAPIGSSTLCDKCGKVLKRIKKYEKELAAIWAP